MAGVLSGCTPPPTPAAGPVRPVYAIDLQGAAKRCTVSAVTPGAEKVATATMTVGNDGGWCAIAVHQPGPEPFAAGLLIRPASRGKVYIHAVGNNTRIDYTPDPGYVGADSFLVTLLPNRSEVQANVTVVR
ncbi:MAG: hypothetical protein JO122_08045 [Acetobacteraceae bacterium]|nr:hypothetical protein [Acetobacteraceae bacterium]